MELKKKGEKKKTKKKKRGETDDKMIQEAVSSTHGLKHQCWYWKQKGRKELLTKQHKGSIK